MKKRIWHRVNTTGDTPAKRTDHSVVLHNRSALLYAGFDGRQRYNDLQELKLTEGRWVPLTSRTGAPRSRFAHSAVMYRDSMIIFAGWDGHDTLQELYEYDAATQFWYPLPPRGTPPAARSCSTFQFFQVTSNHEM